MGGDQDDRARQEIEGGSGEGGTSPGPKGSPPKGHPPAAGPHADPALTNPDSTPGTGALPHAGQGDETDPGTA